MTTTHVPRRRAVQFEEQHAHYRADGWGITHHQHVVRSRVHGHGGLLPTHLSWAIWRWTYARDLAVFTAETVVQVLAAIAIASTVVLGIFWLVTR